MDELAQLTQDFLRRQELMLRAFNALMRYQQPMATHLNPVLGIPMDKPPMSNDEAADGAV